MQLALACKSATLCTVDVPQIKSYGCPPSPLRMRTISPHTVLSISQQLKVLKSVPVSCSLERAANATMIDAQSCSYPHVPKCDCSQQYGLTGWWFASQELLKGVAVQLNGMLRFTSWLAAGERATALEFFEDGHLGAAAARGEG